MSLVRIIVCGCRDWSDSEAVVHAVTKECDGVYWGRVTHGKTGRSYLSRVLGWGFQRYSGHDQASDAGRHTGSHRA